MFDSVRLNIEALMALIGWIVIYLGVAFFAGWWPFSATNSTLPFSEYESVSVNAYFYFPNDQEVYLGRFMGASACQSAAYNYAASKNMSSQNWSYIC